MLIRACKPIWCICFFFLSFSNSSKHTVWVIINNTRAGSKPVDMQISLTDSKNHHMVIAEQEVPAGLQQLPGKKIKEGTYEFSVAANDSQVLITQPVTLDGDRWIMINYVQQDSAAIVKSHGYFNTTRFTKINNQYATIDIYVDSRRPASL